MSLAPPAWALHTHVALPGSRGNDSRQDFVVAASFIAL